MAAEDRIEPDSQASNGGTPKDQVIAQVRYGLSDLKARNGHHEFEEACLHLARARIATNVLPSTGPVSSGGDQGRDFETFHSYLREELGERGWLAGIAEGNAIAFVCTLQDNPVPAKVRGDVEKIMGLGTEVGRIYAFCGTDVPVAARHSLENAVLADFGVALDILDARAIATQIADPETFWIAARYLSIPASIAPARAKGGADEQPEWYRETLADWHQRDTPRPLMADFSPIRDGMRHAAFVADARADLPFWIGLTRHLVGPDADDDLRQRARYEVAACSIRGTGDLRAADELVGAFLTDAIETSDPARLEDASVLLSYAATAHRLGASNLDLAILAERRFQLRDRARSLLSDHPAPVRKARLHQVIGLLALTPDPGMLGEPQTGVDLADTVRVLDEMTDSVLDPDVPRPHSAEDLDEAMESWVELANQLDDVPLFPVESFARLVQLLTPLLVEHPGWSTLTEQLDQAVARTAGGGRAGELCRDRSMALRDAGHLRLAIREMHRAKAEWWTGDTVRGAALALMILAESYGDLGFAFAGKQHALAAAGLSASADEHDVIDLIPRGLLQASEMSYLAGDWMAAIEELEIGFVGIHDLTGLEDEGASSSFQRGLLTAARVLQGARLLVPELAPRVAEVLERLDVLDVVEEALTAADEWTAEEFADRISAEFAGPPFSDLGERYEISFRGLGIRWKLHAFNGYADVRSTQRLAAAIQIALVEIAEDDLCLMPTDIDISVAATSSAQTPEVRQIPSNEGRQFEMRLADLSEDQSVDPEQNFGELTEVLLRLLSEVSLLPASDYTESFIAAYDRGLWHQLAAGRPYDDLARFVTRNHFDAAKRRSYRSPSQVHFDATEHRELRWQDGPGPTFSQAEADDMARNRYDQIPALVPITIERLSGSATFQKVKEELRGRGWLDWHILIAVSNVVLNFRLATKGWNTREGLAEAGRERVEELTVTPESPSEDLPPLDLFSVESLEFARVNSIGSTLANWGLQSRQRTPDLPGIEKVLAERYGYWTIDVPHTDPFVAGDAAEPTREP